MPDELWRIIVEAQSNLGDLQKQAADLKQQLTELQTQQGDTAQLLTGGTPNTSLNVAYGRRQPGEVEPPVRVTERTSNEGVTVTRVLVDEAAATRDAARAAAELESSHTQAAAAAMRGIRQEEAELHSLQSEYDKLAASELKRDIAAAPTSEAKAVRVRAELDRPDLSQTQRNNLESQAAILEQRAARESAAEAQRLSSAASAQATRDLQQEEAELRSLQAEYDKLAVSTLRRDVAAAPTTQDKAARVRQEMARPDLTDPQRTNLEAQALNLEQRAAGESAAEAARLKTAAEAQVNAQLKQEEAELRALQAEYDKLAASSLRRDVAAETSPANKAARYRDEMARPDLSDSQRNDLEAKALAQEQRAAQQASAEVNKLAAAERGAALAGMNHADKIAYLQDELSKLTPGTLEYANTQKQLNQTLNEGYNNMSRFSGLMTKMIASMAVWEGFRMVMQVITEMTDAQIKLSGEVARFGIITGQSVGEATASYLELQKVMAQQGVAPKDSGDSILRTARLTKNPAEQAEITKTAAQMSQVLGIDVGTATEKLISILEQEKRSGMEAGQVFDELIAIYKETGSSVDEIVNAMTEAAVLQDKWNTSSIETKGLIAELSQRANESAETVSGALIRVTNEVQNLQGDKLVEVSRMFREMGVEIQNTTTGEVLPALQVLKNISANFANFTPDQQAKVYEALGLERPQYQQIGRELMSALSDGIVGNLQVIAGAGSAAGKAFSDSFQGVVNKMQASLGILQEQGNVGQNLAGNILAGTVGKWGGVQGAQMVNDYIQQQSLVSLFDKEGGLEKNKDDFVKSLYGMSPEEAQTAIQDYNQKLASAAQAAARANPFDPIGGAIRANNRVQAGLISDDDRKAILDAVQKGTASVRGDDWRKDLAPAARLAPQQPQQQRQQQQGTQSIYTTEGELQNRIRNKPDYLGTQALDMSKLSASQFNMALKESEATFNAILEAQRREMELAGLTKTEIDAKVASMIKEAQLQEVLVEKAGKQYEYVRGIAAINLKDILGEDKFKAPKAPKPESNFEFQRHKEIDPSQWGQLQALTQMYDAMLTKMGSPEKEKNINLLLGQDNTFKTMTARLTALQMAMEDLTKVEKAQLSGTWNMPSGATALVPINSLDLQRWNKGEGGGGGMSPEQLTALLDQMGLAAKQQAASETAGYGSESVVNAVDRSAELIVNAITTSKGVYLPGTSQETIRKSERDQMMEQQDVARAYRQRLAEEQNKNKVFLPNIQQGDSKYQQQTFLPNVDKQEKQQQTFVPNIQQGRGEPVVYRGDRDIEQYRSLLATAMNPNSALMTPARAPEFRQQQTFTPREVSDTARVTSASMRSLEDMFSRGTQGLSQNQLTTSLNTFAQMFANNVNRFQGVGGRGLALGGGGGATQQQQQQQPKDTDIEDYRSRRTTQTKAESAESNTRATIQVGQRVDNTTAAVRAVGSTLMIPLLQEVYQLMLLNGKLGTPTTSTTTSTSRLAAPQSALSPQASPIASQTPGLGPLMNRLMSAPQNNNSMINPNRDQKTQPPPVTVNVSMLPIKAALTANLSVVMDGRVIARALMPLMYEMLTRAARGQSTQVRGVLR